MPGAYTSLYTALYVALAALVFPGSPSNALGAKVELNLNGTWTDITAYVMLRGGISITNMGRADESSSISPCQLSLVLRNDGRFTPLLSSGAYFPYIKRNTLIRVSVNATSATGQGTSAPLNANTGFETNIANWTAGNSATIAQSSAFARTGTFSMSLHGNGTTANPIASAEQDPVIAGHSYTALAYVYNGVSWASGIGIQINWYDSSHNFISNNVGTTIPLNAAAWTSVTVTAAAPPNAAYANMAVYAAGTPASGSIFYVDDATLTPVQNYRFHGEISSWPPGSDISGRDNYVTVTASGIWRRISQSSATIGSAFSRYYEQLTGSSVPLAYWPMEDGNDSTGFVQDIGSTGNGTFAGTPSFSSDGTSFGGSDALPQFSQSRITFPVSGGTPVNNVVRFALSVPHAGDSQIPSSTVLVSGVPTGAVMNWTASSGTIRSINVWIDKNWKLTIRGRNVSGTILFTSTITTPVNGVPVLVSVEITPSGGNVAWAMKIIKPGAGSVLDSVSGTVTTATVGAITGIVLNGNGQLADTSGGHLAVIYSAVPSLTTAASALSGFTGEFAVDRFTRLCGEFGITTEVVGSASATMGPQVDDTLAAILQSIEDTDGGLLFESRTQFGLGYRTLGSLQNQASAATLSYAAGAAPGDAPQPAYDDQLLRNSVTIANYDGYTALAQLTSGAVSIQQVPNGVGVYSGTGSTNATSHSQVNAIAQQKMFQGTVDDVRYPQITVNLAAPHAASLFSAVPSLRIGDYFQLTNLPGTLGGSATSKQLAWGYSETLNADNQWAITFNAVPELPFETTFSPGVYSVGQAPVAGVAQGSAVGSTVAGSQLGAGAALPGTISARTIGGMTSFISASTPYDWTFAVSGTPADVTYFICTEAQSQPIAAGDTFSNSGGFGGPFTVTSVDPPSGGNTTVHFSPDASSVMSSGTVTGGKNGDTWVNTSGGNQVNIWAAGAWVPVSWNASSVLQASSITASLIAAGTIIAGVVDGTTIEGATIIADGTSGEILVYSGTPATGNLIGSWSGASGTDAHSNTFPAGLAVEQGGLVLLNQGSAPGGTSGASTFYSSTAGRPRYLSQVGTDAVLERSEVNVSQFTCNSITATTISPTMNYQPNEGVQSSEFELEIMGVASAPTNIANVQTLDFRVYMDGSNAGGGFTVGTTVFSSTSTGGQNFVFTVRFLMTVTSGGAGGALHIHSDGTIAATANKTPADGATLGGDIDGVSFDCTTSHTFNLRAFWNGGTGSVPAGETLTVYRSKVARRM